MKNHSSNTLSITKNQNELLIMGPLTQDTVITLLASSVALLSDNSSMTVNLQAVTDCDSAGLAFLIMLLRKAKAQQITLTFTHVPKQLQDISLVCGVREILF